MRLIRSLPLTGATAFALVSVSLSVSAGATSAAGPYVCSGTFNNPGTLTGTYPNGVVVKGVCRVNAGKARVIGTLLVTKGSAFLAAFGRNDRTHRGDSSLTVHGDIPRRHRGRPGRHRGARLQRPRRFPVR
jgi:hypothetical protein